MGSAKKQNKSYRTRATRSQGRSNLLTSDPLQNTVLLNNQLGTLGLYAAPTIGDGNCLFRALSDQYYGSPSRYAEVRREICDFIESHSERYEGFVDVDEFGDTGVRKDKGGGLAAYVAGMRQNATYGGHMELSAFAHLTKRNIKVIQPGLVYVIQSDPQLPKSPKSPSKKPGDSPLKYTRSNSAKGLDGDGDASMSSKADQDSTIYVAYHDWEHFSSVRNLRGPHSGIPRVREAAPPPTAGSSSSASPPPEEHLPPSKARKKERERKEKEKKEATRFKAKEKAASNPEKPKSAQRTGFKLKIPPRVSLPPPILTTTAPTPISLGGSPLSSLPPSPSPDDHEDPFDATTVLLPPSAPPSVATSPPVSHSPSPVPGTSSEQLSEPEDADMDSPTADLSATVTLPPLPSAPSTQSLPSIVTYSSAYTPYPLNFVSYPYTYGSYPAHLTQKTPTATTVSYSYPSFPISNTGAGSGSEAIASSASASASTSNIAYHSAQTPTANYQKSPSSLYVDDAMATIHSNSHPAPTPPPHSGYFVTNDSSKGPVTVAIDPLSNLTHLTHLLPPPRIQRSPKRSFEESLGGEEGGGSNESSGISSGSSGSTESKRSRMEVHSVDAVAVDGRKEAMVGDSPEPDHASSTLPSLEGPSTSAADSQTAARRSSARHPPALASSVSRTCTSELSEESGGEDEADGDNDADNDDDDEDYVDDEDTHGDEEGDDDGEEDDLKPNLNRVTRSYVIPKATKTRLGGGKGSGTVSLERPLTRRQRKKLGLPKSRNVNVAPGKVIVPRNVSYNPVSSASVEWTANGNGRVDVRGFRELKI
ncbi:hypothetical protein D9757_010437 [Collybiopsis confluens]|uniref:OTU domain-containing protein n=1 Tax=Collybiopsis confluens TaxID=2823264 RepID=A0A8H5GPL3_9AGAR|nr:hypothetical protein D9757_010437 [Collybiopsis confluens]